MEGLTDAIGTLKVTVDAAGSDYFADVEVTNAVRDLSFALDDVLFC